MSTTCPTCGADVLEDRDTCQVCGADVPVAASGAAADDRPDTEPGAGGDPTGAVPPPPSAGGPGVPPPPGAVPPASWGGAQAHPSGLPSDVRNWGMAAHLSAFLGAWAALAFLGPLVVWLVKREEHPFIDHHAKEALNFNISVLIYGAVALVLSFVLIGIPILIGIGIAWVIFTIIAAVKASNGEGYRYPLTIRFIS